MRQRPLRTVLLFCPNGGLYVRLKVGLNIGLNENQLAFRILLESDPRLNRACRLLLLRHARSFDDRQRPEASRTFAHVHRGVIILKGGGNEFTGISGFNILEGART